MRRALLTLTSVACLALAAVPSAQAAFGLNDFDVTFKNPDGTPATQAGSHPFAMTTSFSINYSGAGSEAQTDGEFRNGSFEQIPGLVGDATAYPRCSTADFLAKPPTCPSDTQVGVATGRISGPSSPPFTEALYNLVPPPGAPARLGFIVEGVVANVIDVGVKPGPPYSLRATASNAAQPFEIFEVSLTIWGVPADPGHDAERTGPGCPSGCASTAALRPFLTLPRSCRGPQQSSYLAESWEGDLDAGSVFTHDNGEPPTPIGFDGCSKIAFGFNPAITAAPTTKAATSPSGLDFNLEIEEEVEGLKDPDGLARSDVKKVVVTLPEGFSANPALAEGLEVCTEAQLQAETAFSAPGEGCPNASKIGTVEVESPLIEENVNGALHVAEPYKNPFGSLIALYIVIKNPNLGIVVRQAAEVKPDPVTGQLTTVVEDIPQLPFTSFRLHFREGTRSPLVSPPACGAYNVKAEITPHSGGAPVTSTSTFQLISGPDGGPCPTGSLPPFKPGLLAGTVNNRAGSYSPFNLRLFRSDAEQEFTRFSIKLPPGITGKLAGVPFCPDAAIEAAKLRTGTEEELNPSCPVASLIGRTLAGVGVGPAPAYAPGKVYLAGPYNGSAISIAAITAAKIGPFDLGTVVVREGFKIDRQTAEVFVDSVGSDPIPHIIDGIPVHARDIRAYVDRPNFVLNPTSCERTSTASTVLGSGLNFASEEDDNPIVVSTPFQAADCAALSFNPKLNLRLIGGTKRGAHPKFRAFLDMRPGEANIAYARVTLPRSAFLDQSHIRTVCTRVQYAANQCPAASVYGYAKAITPLLDEPLQGPVYLRSSEHKLPDLVGALRNGKIEIDLVGRVDSLKGRIRNTFEVVPDAPVDTFVLTMQGGGKGLITNSTDLCKGKHRAVAEFDAHNGKIKDFRPQVRAKCGGKGRNKAKRSGRAASTSG